MPEKLFSKLKMTNNYDYLTNLLNQNSELSEHALTRINKKIKFGELLLMKLIIT